MPKLGLVRGPNRIEHRETDDHEVEESQWIRDIGSGRKKHDAAIAKIFDRYSKQFLTYLISGGLKHDEAEDVVSGFFEKLVKRENNLGDIHNPQGYLWRMLNNCKIDYIRSQAKHKAISDDVCLGGGCDGSTVELQDYVECVVRAFESFKSKFPDRAEAILLVVHAGLSGRELAAALGKTYGATREYLSQARKDLAAITRERCGEDPREL